MIIIKWLSFYDKEIVVPLVLFLLMPLMSRWKVFSSLSSLFFVLRFIALSSCHRPLILYSISASILPLSDAFCNSFIHGVLQFPRGRKLSFPPLGTTVPAERNERSQRRKPAFPWRETVVSAWGNCRSREGYGKKCRAVWAENNCTICSVNCDSMRLKMWLRASKEIEQMKKRIFRHKKGRADGFKKR